MTPAQLALATGASTKWIQNTRRLLRRAARDDAADARWLGLVHELTSALGLPLRQAARCADIALAADPQQHHVSIDFGDERRAAIVLDLWRDTTLHLARLSRALEMPPRERRGRPVTRKRRRADPVERAVTYGLDVSLLYAGRRISVAERLQRLDDNSVFLAEARRGKEKGT